MKKCKFIFNLNKFVSVILSLGLVINSLPSPSMGETFLSPPGINNIPGDLLLPKKSSVNRVYPDDEHKGVYYIKKMGSSTPCAELHMH